MKAYNYLAIGLLIASCSSGGEGHFIETKPSTRLVVSASGNVVNIEGVAHATPILLERCRTALNTECLEFELLVEIMQSPFSVTDTGSPGMQQCYRLEGEEEGGCLEFADATTSETPGDTPKLEACLPVEDLESKLFEGSTCGYGNRITTVSNSIAGCLFYLHLHGGGRVKNSVATTANTANQLCSMASQESFQQNYNFIDSDEELAQFCSTELVGDDVTIADFGYDFTTSTLLVVHWTLPGLTVMQDRLLRVHSVREYSDGSLIVEGQPTDQTIGYSTSHAYMNDTIYAAVLVLPKRHSGAKVVSEHGSTQTSFYCPL